MPKPKKKPAIKSTQKTQEKNHEKVKKTPYDWEAIEKDVRAGILSLREISRRHKAPESSIRKKIKNNGWERDLTDQVLKRAQAKLLRNKVRRGNATDAEIVEEKSEEVVGVIESHRKDITCLKVEEQKILKELGAKPKRLWVGQYQGVIITKELEIAATERAAALNNLANVQHKRIALERQAYNLGDKGALDELIEKLQVEFI